MERTQFLTYRYAQSSEDGNKYYKQHIEVGGRRSNIKSLEKLHGEGRFELDLKG